MSEITLELAAAAGHVKTLSKLSDSSQSVRREKEASARRIKFKPVGVVLVVSADFGVDPCFLCRE